MLWWVQKPTTFKFIGGKKMKTKDFKKAVQEFKNKGFYIDEYETEKRNLKQYKNKQITKYNIYNLEINNIRGFGGCYTFEDCEREIKKFFVDGKEKKIKELENIFISWDRDFFNSDKVGYHDGLKVSYNQLKSLVEEYINKPQFKNIKKSLYCDKWDRERKIKESTDNFKVFVELVLNCETKKDSYIVKEYNQHINFKLVDKNILEAYKNLYLKYLLTLYKKSIWFDISDLNKVLKLTEATNFILCIDTDKNKDCAYIDLNYYQFEKVKKLNIDSVQNYELYAHLYTNEINSKRFTDFKGMINYCTTNNTEQKPQKETTQFLKQNWKETKKDVYSQVLLKGSMNYIYSPLHKRLVKLQHKLESEENLNKGS